MILVFDFDGVICDSMLECIITAHQTYNILYKKKEVKPWTVSNIPPEVIRYYKYLSPFVSTGEDYYIIYYLFEKKAIINGQEDFDATRERKKQYLELIAEQFYRCRELRKKENFSEWIKGNRLYRGIKERIHRLQRYFPVYIVTYKDISSVAQILAHNSLLIPQTNILGRERGITKNEIIKNILTLGISTSLLYIDDHIRNLLNIDNHKVRRFLAEWGYSNKQQIDTALQKGIGVLEFRNFDSYLINNFCKKE